MSEKKVNIPKEDEQFKVKTGLPFGVDDKLNSIDVNHDGKSDVVQVSKLASQVMPPLLEFINEGGLDAFEELLEPKLSPKAKKALVEIKLAASLFK